ncbi:MAG: hypothetical protein V3T05_08565, partial [Myxococcota bacterium]
MPRVIFTGLCAALQVAVCAALLAGGCNRKPMVDGVTLECSVDDHCQAIGDEWRCYESVCVENTPPVVRPFDVLRMTLGANIDVVAVTDDFEDDTSTFTWTQVSGPTTLLASPLENARLLVTPTEIGIHVFQVIGNDSFSPSEPALLTVIVQPDADAIYIWKGGEDSSACGTFDAPCATVGQGLAIMRAATSAPKPVLLAAATGVDPYADCIHLTGNEQLRGCFDPVTWTHDPTLRERCRIECDETGGHSLSGDASLRDVALAMSPATPLPTGNDPLPTLWLHGGAPTVDDVDIETAPCGDGCIVGGVASIYSDALIRGVEIRGGVVGFDPVDIFIGMVVIGGAPTFEGKIDAAGNRRGSILMNAPADDTALGVVASLSEILLTDVTITGGLATTLRGIHFLDGSPAVQNVTIDLVGFGSQELGGIAVLPCVAMPEFCRCPSASPACPATLPPAPDSPVTT